MARLGGRCCRPHVRAVRHRGGAFSPSDLRTGRPSREVTCLWMQPQREAHLSTQAHSVWEKVGLLPPPKCPRGRTTFCVTPLGPGGELVVILQTRLAGSEGPTQISVTKRLTWAGWLGEARLVTGKKGTSFGVGCLGQPGTCSGQVPHGPWGRREGEGRGFFEFWA